MFTGIVEVQGNVVKAEGSALSVDSKLPKPKLGASVAINGCCLTVVETKGAVCRFDVGPETLRRTNLGELKAGSTVNVEGSLKLGDLPEEFRRAISNLDAGQVSEPIRTAAGMHLIVVCSRSQPVGGPSDDREQIRNQIH